MGHPFDAAWSIIVQKGEYVNPASPLLSEALNRARSARPPYLANQRARNRAADNPQGHSREDFQWMKEQGLDPKLGMKHNVRTALRLDRTPKPGQRMNIGGYNEISPVQVAPAGSREAAKLAQMKHPPSPRYSPEGPRGSHPLSNAREMGSGPSAEDTLFDLAAPEVYNPGNMPSSPMQRAMIEQQQTAQKKLSPLARYAANEGPTSRRYMRSG